MCELHLQKKNVNWVFNVNARKSCDWIVQNLYVWMFNTIWIVVLINPSSIQLTLLLGVMSFSFYRYLCFCCINFLHWIGCLQEPVLERYLEAWLLAMPGTQAWSSSFSAMLSWALPCLRLWDFSVLWWLSCYCLLSNHTPALCRHLGNDVRYLRKWIKIAKIGRHNKIQALLI